MKQECCRKPWNKNVYFNGKISVLQNEETWTFFFSFFRYAASKIIARLYPTIHRSYKTQKRIG